MSALLSVRNLDVAFDGPAGPVPVVRSLSLEIGAGEVFGLVGESGSGKSTIANAVMGLLPASAQVTGDITLGGRNIGGLPEDQLRGLRGREMGMVFQDATTSLDPTWSVGEQVAETLLAHGAMGRAEARARAVELLQEVGIPEAARRYRDPPHRFSGGQRQRIVIAAAIANAPKLLIADEPTTALDVTIQAQILGLIDTLRRRHGTSVLLITHDLGVVAQTCDRVAVMHRGRILETGRTGAVFAAPTHPYTRALMAANPAWAPRGSRLPVVPREWSLEEAPNG